VAADETLLDNPVYAALSGPQARFAQVRGRVRRYPPDVSPFMGMPDRPSADDWRDAASLVMPGTYAGMLRTGAETPDDWTMARSFNVAQMVAEPASGADWAQAVALGADDVPEMMELVAQTEPGPFLKRTVELGNYLGVRDDGMLVAMAGERLRVEGWTEISAVCTLPAYRGRGLASALMAALMAGIERRGELAFLHVMTTNAGAIKLYEELGFRVRRTATIGVVAPRPAAG
jgi:ribosomal protein S18 acetylase RimI-like enzyme